MCHIATTMAPAVLAPVFSVACGLLLATAAAAATTVTAPLGPSTVCEFAACVSPGSSAAVLIERLQSAPNGTPAFTSADGRACALSVNGVRIVKVSDVGGFAAALRHLHLNLRIYARNRSAVIPVLPEPFKLLRRSSTRPRWHLRGHQIAMSNHLYQFEKPAELGAFLTDLNVFGTNFIEVAHVPGPILSNATSEALIAISKMLAARNMNMSIWWSAAFVRANMNALRTLFPQMPALNSLFFPGGDGGELSWADIIAASDALRQGGHPSSSVWVSAQEVGAQTLEYFIAQLKSNATVRDALGPNGGAVYGPHNRVTLVDFVEMLSAEDRANSGSPVNVRQYPDLAHSLNAQFPILGWDAPWAMAYGRQVVNPRPAFYARVLEDRSNGSSATVGVGAYSEGLNDDLNKVIFSRMGEDSSVTMMQTVREYARYFFGAEAEDDAVAGLLGLEMNWQGRTRDTEERVASTLASLEAAAQKSLFMTPEGLGWRMTMYLRRALMDAFVQRGHLHDLARVSSAKAILNNISISAQCTTAVKQARVVLSSSPADDPQRAEWLRRILDLTASLNNTVGADVVQTQDKRLNLDSLHVPERLHSDYLLNALGDIISSRGSNCSRAVALLLSRTDPGDGGFYDNMGSVRDIDHPHLLGSNDHGGAQDMGDPSGFYTAVQSEYEVTSARCRLNGSILDEFYDAPLRLRYSGLDRTQEYELKIVYWHPNRDSTDGEYRLLAISVEIVARF